MAHKAYLFELFQQVLYTLLLLTNVCHSSRKGLALMVFLDRIALLKEFPSKASYRTSLSMADYGCWAGNPFAKYGDNTLIFPYIVNPKDFDVTNDQNSSSPSLYLHRIFVS